MATQLWGFYNAADPASEAYADGTKAWRKFWSDTVYDHDFLDLFAAGLVHERGVTSRPRAKSSADLISEDRSSKILSNIGLNPRGQNLST